MYMGGLGLFQKERGSRGKGLRVQVRGFRYDSDMFVMPVEGNFKTFTYWKLILGRDKGI